MTQKEIQSAITNTILTTDRCIISASPRSGKTKACLDALKKIKGSILVSCPTQVICDNWLKECEKWNFPSKRLTIICHSSLHLQKRFDVLVIDEAHAVISELRIWGIKNINPKRIIALSGSFSTKAKEMFLNELKMTVSYEYSIQQAVDDGTIKDYEIIVHKVALSPLEAIEYRKLSNKVDWAKNVGGKALMFTSLARQRWLHNLTSKNIYAKKLIDNLTRYILFAPVIATVNQLCSYTLHSKNMGNALQLFQEEKINNLGLVKLASEGITFKNLSVVVIVGINSSEVNSIQRILRALTKEANKTATIHVIISSETQESDVWSVNALKPFNQSKIKIIT